MDVTTAKTRARLQAKGQRQKTYRGDAGPELIRQFPADRFRGKVIAGFWPLPGEIDIKPLLLALYDAGHSMCLPCTPRKGRPLVFREWEPGDAMRVGPYGTREPHRDTPEVRPDFVFLPLLAFTQSGERLGYGGGFYDRTLADLRAGGDIFACGAAFTGQQAASLPVDTYDQPLDGILTPNGFKDF